MDQELTEHQRWCLEHIRQARALKTPLTEYARSHGLSVRMLYDATVQLKTKGLIAGPVKAFPLAKRRPEAVAPKERSPFVAVRIQTAPAQTGDFLPVLRLNHVAGHVLEFGSWPPAEVMTTILAGGRDDTA